MNYNNKISIFRNFTDKNPIYFSLLHFCENVISGDYKDEVEIIRKAALISKEAKEKAKLNTPLPWAAISGTFTTYGDNYLIKHSGFVCIDIDPQHNPTINDWCALRDSLSSIDNVFFASLSCSGLGVFLIVPILSPTYHKLHYIALEEDFKTIGIKIDPACKNISRLRIFSSDPDAVINKNAVAYERVYTPPKPKCIFR